MKPKEEWITNVRSLSTTYVTSSITNSFPYYYEKCVFVLLNENGSHAARCWPQKLFIFLHNAPESELAVITKAYQNFVYLPHY